MKIHISNFPPESTPNVLWTKEWRGRCKKNSNVHSICCRVQCAQAKMRESMLEINRSTKDYILVVTELHSAGRTTQVASYACFSNAVAIVEFSEHHRAPSEHFRGLLVVKSYFYMLTGLILDDPAFKLQKLESFEAHEHAKLRILADDCAPEGLQKEHLYSKGFLT